MQPVTTSLLSVVVPLYNEEDNVALLTQKIHESLVGYDYQIIYVDDFSKDDTKKVVKALKDDKVHLIELKKNYGQSLALAAGLDYAEGEYIITMDGDLQNDPSDIPEMLTYAVSEEYDVVTGIRQKRKDSLVKKIPSKIANFLVRRITKLDIKDNGCALKVFTKDIAKDLNLYGEMHRFITLLAHLEGAQIKQIPVKHHARHAGVSKYGLERVFKVVADMMLLLFIRKYFQRPIHLFGIFGFLLILLGIIINLYLLVVKLGFAAGIAFSTKGQISLLVIGLPILCHLLYTGKWKVFLSWKVLVALLVFGVTISPMLYAYYLQFDLHPEKVIRGKDNRSGIFFIFWEQSFERLSGEGIGKNSSDFFFFFHTFLWVFLPWTILGVAAYYAKARRLIKLKFKYNAKFEVLTLGGITLIFAVISFAQFKLPHYLNITIPLFAVLTASYLYDLYRFDREKATRLLMKGQYFILGVVFIASALICFYVFELKGIVAYISLIIAGVIIIFYALKREGVYVRLITISVCASLLLNAVLNLHFYPNLLEFQGGSSMAKIIKLKNIPVDRVYKVSSDYTWSLDFYNQYPVQIATPNLLKGKKDIWVYASDEDMSMLQNSGLDWNSQISVDQFRITRLQGKFLNPSTRKKVTRKMHLLHIY